MKKDIESILTINQYLINHKNDYEKRKLIRMYLTSKLDKILNKNKDIISPFLNFQLGFLSV